MQEQLRIVGAESMQTNLPNTARDRVQSTENLQGIVAQPMPRHVTFTGNNDSN